MPLFDWSITSNIQHKICHFLWSQNTLRNKENFALLGVLLLLLLLLLLPSYSQRGIIWNGEGYLVVDLFPNQLIANTKNAPNNLLLSLLWLLQC